MTVCASKKLIEVALPLDDINTTAAREKSIRHGHPSTLHLWWARHPLAAARAVLFAQMVNERGWYAGKTKAQVDAEREALFDIIRELVKWENTTNAAVLERARAAIRRSWRETCELNVSLQDMHEWRLEQASAVDGGLEAERTRLTKAQADHEELKVTQLRGELIPAGEIEEAWTGMVTASAPAYSPCRAALPLCWVAESNHATIHKIIQDVCYEAPTELAQNADTTAWMRNRIRATPRKTKALQPGRAEGLRQADVYR